MGRTLRVAAGTVGAVLAFLLLAWPLARAELHLQRAAYVLAEGLGLLGGAAGAKQILGTYIPGPPPWVEIAVSFLAAAVALSPAFWGASLVAASPLGLRAPWRQRPRAVATAAVLLTLAFAVGVVAIRWFGSDAFRRAILELGTRAGCMTYGDSRGIVVVGVGGPFHDGRWRTLFNALWSQGPTLLLPVLPFLVCLFLARAAFARIRPVPGRCASCGYDLRGIAGDRCPECGRLVADPSTPAPPPSE